MNIIFYSNCQSIGLKYFLENKFPSNYVRLENFKFFENNLPLPINILKNADIFIFQFTNKSHGIYSTDPTSELNIFKYLKPSCIKIGFPSIFQNSFWPLFSGFEHKSNSAGLDIIKELKKNYSLDEILNKYDNNEINFNLKKRFNECESYTKNLEQFYILNSNYYNYNVIEITPFIRNNYKKYKLFLSHCHPTTYVYVYITNKIIEILNNKLNLNLELYNIFNREYIIDIIPGIDPYTFQDSKYIIQELNVEYINNTNENYFKNIIKSMYYKCDNLNYSFPESAINI